MKHVDPNQPLMKQHIDWGLTFCHSGNPSSTYYFPMTSSWPKYGEVLCSRHSHNTTRGKDNIHYIKIPNEYQIHMTIINMTYPMSSGTKVTTHKA